MSSPYVPSLQNKNLRIRIPSQLWTSCCIAVSSPARHSPNGYVSGIPATSSYEARDGEHFLDAVQNARVAANAERYYRIMYYGSRESWNLRDQHIFDTLETVLAFRSGRTRPSTR